MVVHTDKDNAFYIFSYLSLSPILCIIQLFVFLVIFLSFKRKKNMKIPGYGTNDLFQLSIFANTTVKRKAFSHGVGLFQLFNAIGYSHQKEGMMILLPNIHPFLFLHKAEHVEVLLSGKNFKKGFEYHFIKDWFKDSIFGRDVEKWRYARKISKPAFHTRLLDEAMTVVNKKSKLLNEKLDSVMKSNQHVDIALMLEICALDIICEAGMGAKKQEENIIAFNNAWKRFKALTVKRVCCPWLWPDMVYFNTQQGKEANSCIKLMEKFDREMVAEKKSQRLTELEDNVKNNNTYADQLSSKLDEKNDKNLTILDVLLNHHFLNENFTQEDVAKEIDVFIIGGYDTVAASTSWAIYMLGLYPDIQKKVHQELDSVVGKDIDKEITREDVKELKYLECVMKNKPSPRAPQKYNMRLKEETRRLFPPIPISGRVLEEDIVIGTYAVPKGTTCIINIYMLHRDPAFFQNPEAFYPERFLDNTKRNPYAFIPFLAGPRNCIGQKFGILETIILVANVLRRFEVKSLLPLDKIFINVDVTLGTDNGLPMIFLDRYRDHKLQTFI